MTVHDGRHACCVKAGVGRSRMQYIVLDHVERIKDSDLLAVLLRLKELTGRCPSTSVWIG